MIKKCDLCGKKTTQITTPGSMMRDVKDLDGMCPDCMEILDVAYLAAQKLTQQLIRDKMVEATDEIRAQHKS